MKASEVIEQLRNLMREAGGDPEVLAQSNGCCYDGHDIRQIEFGGGEMPGKNPGRCWPDDEADSIVIRV